MSRGHFWRSISRDTNVEVSAFSPYSKRLNHKVRSHGEEGQEDWWTSEAFQYSKIYLQVLDRNYDKEESFHEYDMTVLCTCVTIR